VQKTDSSQLNEKPIKSQPFHAIPNREFERVEWSRKITDDTSRLPSMYHILFAILDSADVPVFTAAIKQAGQTAKMVEGLGGFAICESETKAEALFKELSPSMLIYPLKDVPKAIRNDQLRSEICFMEGVRPQKNTSVANRLIYQHLGFK